MASREEEHEIGPLSYVIKKSGGKFQLWLGGCRIGRPRADRPGEIWEYAAPTLDAARQEMLTDAKERLRRRIEDKDKELLSLRGALRKIDAAHFFEGETRKGDLR